MTKRKSTGRGKKKTTVAAPSASPSPRPAMEGVLALFGGGGPRDTPLDRAQELMYQAWEESSVTRRVALARKALEVTFDCADAYVLLAEYGGGGLAESIALLREGVAAGERALGKDAFEDDVGHFWGLLETRPYMRARAALARRLGEAEHHEEAVVHYRDLLRLNPSDNQGVRYELAACLLALGRDEDLAALLQQYHDDDSATWAYSAALLAFRRGGDDEGARQRLVQAKAVNPHVPAYLLGQKKLPRWLPDYIGMGDENEAIVYASSAAFAWKQAAGALDWLRRS